MDSIEHTLREALAEYAHTAWSGWMKHLLECCSEVDKEGVGYIETLLTIPEWAKERWTRQMNTAYRDLPEEEKASDRTEADRMIEIFRKIMTEV